MTGSEQEVADEIFKLHAASGYTRLASRAFGLNVNERLSRRDLVELSAVRRFRTFVTPPIEWPSPVPPNCSFAAAVQNRRSHRAFTAAPLGMAELSNVFSFAFQSSRKAKSRVGPIWLHFGPYPSGGGLYPIDILVVLFNTERHQDTLCWYDPLSHELHPVQHAISRTAWRAALMNQMDWLDGVGAAVVFTARWRNTTDKYGVRGYRFALLEAGAAAQSLTLACAAMGLGSLLWGGYVDGEIHDLLGVNPMEEAVVNVGFIGTIERSDNPSSDAPA